VRVLRSFIVLALARALVASPAFADEATEPGTSGTSSTATPTSNRINLRLGSATSDSTGRPTICVDVSVVRGFGVESCGTGQGIIHDESGTELAHFRATYTLATHTTSSGTGRLRGGLGWAELQVGVDHPGFHFGDPDSVDRGSVAGPEAALQAQWLVPLKSELEAVISFTGGVAVFADADKLIAPQSNVQPFVSAEIGLGW
jgi:hypothetical protein